MLRRVSCRERWACVAGGLTRVRHADIRVAHVVRHGMEREREQRLAQSRGGLLLAVCTVSLRYVGGRMWAPVIARCTVTVWLLSLCRSLFVVVVCCVCQLVARGRCTCLRCSQLVVHCSSTSRFLGFKPPDLKPQAPRPGQRANGFSLSLLILNNNNININNL